MDKDLISYRYSDALLPNKFVICGVALQPFCLGHYMLLQHVQNPILNDTAVDVSIEDGLHWFFLALLICSFTYEEALQLLNDEEVFAKVSSEFFDNLSKVMKADEGWNFFAKMNLFKEYLRYYMEMPIYTEETDASGGVPSGTDWTQNMFLIFKKLGYPESAILNMNMKKLFYEWCSYAEAEGAIKVMNRIDIEGLKRLKASRK